MSNKLLPYHYCIKTGVSQGSVPGLLLFSLYINDLLYLNTFLALMYAGDTTLYCDLNSDMYMYNMKNIINVELSYLYSVFYKHIPCQKV